MGSTFRDYIAFVSVDFDRGQDPGDAGPGAQFGMWSLVAGTIAMALNMFWIPVLNVVFTFIGLAFAALGLRGDRRGTDDHSRAVAGGLLGLGNLAVLMVVLVFQVAVAALVGGLVWLGM